MIRRIVLLAAAVVLAAVVIALPAPSSASRGVEDAPLVAADRSGRVLELDPLDGEVSGVLAGPGTTGGQVAELSVAPDGATVWLAVHDPLRGLPCDGRITALRRRSGSAEPVATGFAPAVSPDGRHLAYVATTPTADEACTYEVAVRNLSTGHERRSQLEGPWQHHYGICSLAWTRDGRRLAVETCYESDSLLHLVAAGGSEPIGDASLVGPADPQRSWMAPTEAGGGDITVVERCCNSDPLHAHNRIVVVDGGTGEHRPLSDLGAAVESVGTMARSPGGDGLALVAFTMADGAAPELLRWDGDRLLRLRQDVIAVDW